MSVPLQKGRGKACANSTDGDGPGAVATGISLAVAGAVSWHSWSLLDTAVEVGKDVIVHAGVRAEEVVDSGASAVTYAVWIGVSVAGAYALIVGVGCVRRPWTTMTAAAKGRGRRSIASSDGDGPRRLFDISTPSPPGSPGFDVPRESLVAMQRELRPVVEQWLQAARWRLLIVSKA